MNKLEATLVGVAGAYLVAGELSLRGYLASITLRNSRGIDIIISSHNGAQSASIQVKTSSGNIPAWILSKKAETFCSANHFYVFVLLKEIGERPDFYIVPSEHVANYVKTSHAEWLLRDKRDGMPRKDTNMRKFNDHKREFLEKWDFISL